MKNSFNKILSIVFVLVLAFSCFAITVQGASQTTDLFTLDSVKNMGISVTYDVTPPTVEFVAPNGEIYGADAIAAGKMTKTDSGKALYFRIPNAQAGSWKITYDKKNNSVCEVKYGPYATGLTIENFSFTKTNDNTLNVKFLAKHDKKISYEYIVYAAVSENGQVSGQKEIGRGNATSGEQKAVNVSLDSLSTYQNYQLLLEVNANDNGLTVFDSKVATEKFSYVDPNAEEAPNDFYIETDVTTGTVLVNWENTRARGRDTLVTLFVNDSAEPLYYNTFAAGTNSTKILFDTKTTNSIRVELIYRSHNGKNSAVSSRTIDMNVAKAVSINTGEVTSSAQTEISYKLSSLQGGPFKAFLTVNGTEQELLLEGDKSFSVNLQEFNNEVYLLWYLDEFTAFKIGNEIYSDRLAPTLRIPDAANIVKVDKSTYILSGTVDVGCTVTVNGTPVNVDANGIFTTALNLNVGQNTFEVVAKGPNGNSSKQIVVVEWVETGVISSTGKFGVIISFLPLIISALFAVVALAFTLSMRKKYRTVKENNDKRTAVIKVLKGVSVFMMIISILLTGFFAVMLVFSIKDLNSASFYDVAAKSIIEAYGLIKKRNSFIIGTVVSFVCIGLFIGLLILLNKIEKNPKGVAKKAKAPKKPKAPKPPKQPKNVPLPPVQNQNTGKSGLESEGPKTPNKPNTAAKPVEGPAVNKGNFCTKCGTANTPGNKFCKKCGNPLKN